MNRIEDRVDGSGAAENRMPEACRASGHDWQYGEHYCPYTDGYSSRAFDCGTCGDLPFCGGEMARRACGRCGKQEWIYTSEIMQG